MTGTDIPSPGSAPRRPLWSWRLLALIALWVIGAIAVREQGAAPFLERWPLFFVAVFGAVVGNATAVGGGLIFVPYMILFENLDPLQSLELALVVQAFGMTSGAVAWFRRGAVPRRGLGFMMTGLFLGCAVGTFVVAPNALQVKSAFGPVSIGIGLLVWVLAGVHGREREFPRRALPMLVVASAVGGLLTSWVAIGAGEVVAAVLMVWLRVQADRAVALGVVLLSSASIVLGSYYAWRGGVPWDLAVVMVPGVVLGARLAPTLVARLPETGLKRLFAFIAIADGLLFSLQAVGVL